MRKRLRYFALGLAALGLAAGALGLWRAHRKAEGHAVYIFALHRVLPDIRDPYSITPQQLDDFLAELTRCGFTPWRLEDLERLVREGGRLPPRPAVLTFDDAYFDVYAYALPVLQRRGWPAVFFVPTCKIADSAETRISWDEGPDPRGATWDELRALRDAGMDFGSHSVSHPNLTRLPAEDARRELNDSRAELERRLERPIRALAYPGGRQSAEVRELARRAGYSLAFLSDGGEWIPGRSDRHAIPRINVPGNAHVKGLVHRCLRSDRELSGDRS